MKPVVLLVMLGATVASHALAQSQSSQSSSQAPPSSQARGQTSRMAPALPPPDINDPGVNIVPPAPAGSSARPAATAPQKNNDTPAGTDQSQSSELDANGDPPPQIAVHQQDGNTIQEYSRNGQVYMVVVTPKTGVTQVYMVDQKGTWTDHSGTPVQPVMYRVLEWGKSKSSQEQDQDDNP